MQPVAVVDAVVEGFELVVPLEYLAGRGFFFEVGDDVVHGEEMFGAVGHFADAVGDPVGIGHRETLLFAEEAEEGVAGAAVSDELSL